jgi:4-hydroxy-tetrahydrodipicolinate synthase
MMQNFSPQSMHGIYPAALTMFDAQGELDEKATWNHADWLIRQGVHGLVAAGTSGEFIALTDGERKRVIEIILDAARGRVPVIAHTGYYSTRQTIELTRWAAAAGADAALLILPYYQKPDKPSVLRHYRMVRESTSLPLLAYNNPANSACEELKPWEMADLAKEGVLQGVKSTMVLTTPVVDLKILAPPDFRVFYGSFQAALQGLVVGADGWISGILNLIPAEAVQLYQACCVTKDLDRARTLWYRIVPFANLYFRPRHGPVADLPLWRAGLELRGQHGGASRPPFFTITPEQREDLRAVMAGVGII